MAEFTERWHTRLRNAQRDLLDDIGIERATELTSMSKSQVGRWRSPTDRDLMPLPVVLVLEAYTARPLVSQVMADFHGRRLTAPDEREAKIACLTTQVADLVGQVSTLMARTAQAGSDGFYSVAEVNELMKLNSQVRRAGDVLDDVLATVKTEGGLSLVKGGAA
ncbi:hypothetical protein WHT83_14860 [Aminobacter sp. P9b]|uniref:hypothetical protein n=1 Tax=Aminobacter sp. P9b TaxID=3133697 RepID=UPI0032448520